jgi:hypothetical protein
MCSSTQCNTIVFMAAAVLIGAGYGWAVALFPVVRLAGVVARVESTRRRGLPSARSAAACLMRNPKRVESIPANAAPSCFPWWWN